MLAGLLTVGIANADIRADLRWWLERLLSEAQLTKVRGHCFSDCFLAARTQSADPSATSAVLNNLQNWSCRAPKMEAETPGASEPYARGV